MTATASDWQTERTDAAAQRILDVAEKLYATDGVDGVTMRALATAVGCSRATLYRYYPSREAVQAAFVERSAGRIAKQVATTARVGNPGEQLIAAVTTVLRLVRENRAFANWFHPDGVATAAQLAVVSPAIERVAREFLSSLHPGSDTDPTDRARWLVRIMLSLLSTPGASPDDEARMLASFVVPVVVG
ncbi:putative TetR family transcriptional regulator [Gordonia araii NBRC 100433]|uniref:Putative TetR family transcriptional regulator n=1 Tax=Gordonia araii NBRC 100433 TaxID=1073574 RepID=G7H1G5_9ACTN|nr:TetR/AcrR family transcriptional regulator [Gordonia araii]NNG97801.1 TetR/AcrR family transcriptional regulator [Gordonia araii NBRC 100433]GAB09690.1 putative TetR family transcriptional regulator [Gordonia araii NBRC 100433]